MIVSLDEILVTVALVALSCFSAGLLLGLTCGGTRRAGKRFRRGSLITQSFDREKARGESGE